METNDDFITLDDKTVEGEYTLRFAEDYEHQDFFCAIASARNGFVMDVSRGKDYVTFRTYGLTNNALSKMPREFSYLIIGNETQPKVPDDSDAKE